jgi:cytochrome c oxidase cbb3-type subunit III
LPGHQNLDGDKAAPLTGVTDPKYSSGVRLALFFLLTAVGAAQNTAEPHAAPGLQNPFRDDSQAVAVGGEVFQAQCSACHGAKGEGGSGPSLLNSDAIGGPEEDLFQIVARGRDIMPGFRNLLGENNVWRVITYLQSLPDLGPPSVTGDPVVGGKLFWGKGGCGGCHRVGPNGASVGPNLTRIGRKRGPANLRQSIVDPDAEVPRGYETITVVTSDGLKIQGVQLSYDNFSAQLLDLQNNFHSYLRSEVQQIERSQKTLMPSYAKMFSEAELTDLIAYLSSLGRKEK